MLGLIFRSGLILIPLRRNITMSVDVQKLADATPGVDIIWIVVFSFILVGIVVVHHFMMTCIRDKAPGSKTLFDAVFKDTLWFTGFSGSVFCTIDIISR